MGKTYKNKLKEKDFYEKASYKENTCLWCNRKHNGNEYYTRRKYKEIRRRVNNKFEGTFLSTGNLKRIRVWDVYW